MTIPSSLASSLSERYEILRELGVGGMATVYLAHDLRHDRDVAIKVLHPDLGAALGADRFLAEIKTTAKLQHPHILTLLDSGSADGMLYYVMPVVTGESLRDRLQRERQLPINEAVRIAREIAGALDYAHRHGVIHRDIKPENILLHDGSAIVADFGIALAVQSASGPRMTQTGLSLGTPQYMSPEQAMGERQIDARADIYALGAVTYEMLTGDPPFSGSSVQAIVARVMTERPTAPHVLRDTVPPHVERAVLEALEKLPADRFATAAEFSAGLDDRMASSGIAPSATLAPIAARRASARTMILGGVLAAATLIAGVLLGRYEARGSGATARYSQKTFDGEPISSARFAPDGKTLVMTIGLNRELRVIRPDYPEAQSLGLTDTQLLAVSSQGELALLVRAAPLDFTYAIGTLARMPLGGGAPRELTDSVTEADWSPDGAQLAIVRADGGKARIEYPIGKTLIESTGWMTDLRMAPDGQHLAYVDHPLVGDNRGTIAMIDLSGTKTTLSPEYSGILGLAWSRDGRELYYSTGTTTHQSVILAVTLGKKVREVLNGPGDLTIHDVAANGAWLVTREADPMRAVARDATDSVARPVGWQDFAMQLAMSRDGKQLTMSDGSREAGDYYALWLRRGGGQHVARIGQGSVSGFFRNGNWALSVLPTTPAKLMMYPTGAGTERQIPTPGFDVIDNAEPGPGDDSVLVCGHGADKTPRCVFQDLEGHGQHPSPVAPRTRWSPFSASISPDGRSMIGWTRPGGAIPIVSLVDRTTRMLPGSNGLDQLVRWSPDGRSVWVVRGPDSELQSIDVSTGARTTLIKSMAPSQGPTVVIGRFVVSDDAKSYAYVVEHSSSDLFVVTNVR